MTTPSNEKLAMFKITRLSGAATLQFIKSSVRARDYLSESAEVLEYFLSRPAMPSPDWGAYVSALAQRHFFGRPHRDVGPRIPDISATLEEAVSHLLQRYGVSRDLDSVVDLPGLGSSAGSGQLIHRIACDRRSGDKYSASLLADICGALISAQSVFASSINAPRGHVIDDLGPERYRAAATLGPDSVDGSQGSRQGPTGPPQDIEMELTTSTEEQRLNEIVAFALSSSEEGAAQPIRRIDADHSDLEAHAATKQCQVEITLNRDFTSYSPAEQAELLAAIKRMLGVDTLSLESRREG